ncbi:hypothetical protein V8G54_015356 [Vigna mungo]|uniref:Uncharacterized protein n=1 Tax=Vigna mungo TaxID=3915 RepID=A0AAQ3NJ71_VIGMU
MSHNYDGVEPNRSAKHFGYKFQEWEVNITSIDKIKSFKVQNNIWRGLSNESPYRKHDPPISLHIISRGRQETRGINKCYLKTIDTAHNFLDAISSWLKCACGGFCLTKYRIYGSTFTDT